jgi:tetratricopeptide (TPR) repeat protein
LQSAREELPQEALTYLASQSQTGFESISVSAESWRREDLVRWERKTAQWARELIQQDRYEEVDKELRLRPERSPGSPLFLVHARVLTSLGRYDEARRLLEHALPGWPPQGSQTERIDLLLVLVRVLLLLGNGDEADSRLQVADTLLRSTGSVEQRLQAATLAVRVAPDETRAGNARAALASVAGSWRESQFREVPDLARRAAAELLGHDNLGAARIIRSVGLGPLESPQQERLAAALDSWDRLSWASAAADRIYPSGIASIGPSGMESIGGWRMRMQNPATSRGAWQRWLETTVPAECGDRLAQMLEQWEPIAPVIEALQDILRGRDNVTARRAAEALTAEQKLSRDELVTRIVRLITSAFAHEELNSLVRVKFDVRLDDMEAPTSSMGRKVFDLLRWAEDRGKLRELVRAVAEELPARPDAQELLRLVEE